MTLIKANSSAPKSADGFDFLSVFINGDNCFVGQGRKSLLVECDNYWFRRLGQKPLRHFARPYRRGLCSHSLPGCCVQIVLDIESNSPREGHQSEREEEAKNHMH